MSEALERAVKLEVLDGGRAIVNGQRVVGAPIKLSDEVIEEIVRLVEMGNYLDVACAAAGVTASSIRKWRNQGEKVERMYPDLELDEWPEDLIPAGVTYAEWQAYKLVMKMRLAEAKAEAFAVVSVRKHMPEQWTAAMTYLERRFPERWRKRQTIESEHKVSDGLDEAAILQDPESVRLVHDALERLSSGEVVAEVEAPAEAGASDELAAD